MRRIESGVTELVNLSTISNMSATLNSTKMVANAAATSIAETQFLLKDSDDGMENDGEDLKFSKNET